MAKIISRFRLLKKWSATNLASFLRQGNSSGMAAKCRKSWKPRRRRPKKRFPPRRLKLDTSIYRNLDIMQFKFYLRNLRIAPRKVRSVAALIKRMPALSAQNQLGFQVRRPAESLLKLLKSGIASADRNFNVKADHLYIRNILVDEGPMLKRFRPRAHGRAGAIHKKTSHITLVLESVGAAVSAAAKKSKLAAKKAGRRGLWPENFQEKSRLNLTYRNIGMSIYRYFEI